MLIDHFLLADKFYGSSYSRIYRDFEYDREAPLFLKLIESARRATPPVRIPHSRDDELHTICLKSDDVTSSLNLLQQSDSRGKADPTTGIAIGDSLLGFTHIIVGSNICVRY